MTEGLSRSGFDIDLRDGQASENRLATVLRMSTSRVEVKQAHRAAQYGAVFVELYQTLYPPPRRSGLAVTQAEWWAWDLGGSFVLLPTSEQSRLVCLAYEKHGSTWGGDYNKFFGVRVPLRWLVELPKAEPRITLETILEAPGQTSLI